MKKNSFNDLINGETPVLVDFYATWCGPCKTQAPILDKVKEKIKQTGIVLKVDVDKNQAAAARFNVRSIPTLVLFHKGKILWRKSGVATERELMELFK